MRYLLPLLCGLLLLSVVCNPPAPTDKPTVQATAVDNGFTLRLSWTAIADASEYRIYFDGATTPDTSITGTQIDIKDPCKKIEVTAYNASGESDRATVDCAPVVTTGLTVYGMSDPSPFNSIGFSAATGTCTVIDDTVVANQASMDYFFEDRSGIPMSLYSPNENVPPFNTKIDVSNAAGNDFDALDSAKSGGNSTMTQIQQNTVYSLWMGTSTTWSTNDHFGKLLVETISGTRVTISKVAYQKVGGLRWLVTP